MYKLLKEGELWLPRLWSAAGWGRAAAPRPRTRWTLAAPGCCRTAMKGVNGFHNILRRPPLFSHQRISLDTVLSWHSNKAAAAGTLVFKDLCGQKVSSNIVKTIAKFRCHIYLQQVIEQSPLIRPAINLWNVHFIAEGIVKIFYCCLFDQSSQPALLLSSNIEPSLIGWRGGGSYIRKRKSQKHKLDIWIESSCPASGR